MTILEEITARRKAFHANIAARAKELESKPRINKLPGLNHFALKPKPSAHPIVASLSDENAWTQEICGQAEYVASPVVSLRRIALAIADHFGITLPELLSARRTQDLTHARFIGFFLARELTSASLPMIGRHFGGRDHTTVLNGLNKIEIMMSKDHPISKDIKIIYGRLVG